MARPLVLVFQELAAPTATPSIPDLNTVLVGPVYDLLDYPDDAKTILLADVYGQLNQGATYVPPISGVAAVTILDGAYPEQSPGSLIDRASVGVVLRSPRVILGSTNAAVTPRLGTHVTMVDTDRTLVTLAGSLLPFVAAGIQAGDRIVLTSAHATPQTYVRTVARVGEPNSAGLVEAGNVGVLRLSQELPEQGTSATTFDYATVGIQICIERTLPTQALVDAGHTHITFPESEDATLALTGGIALVTAVTPVPTVDAPLPTITFVERTLSYAGLYLPYRALRQDRQILEQYTPASLTTVNGTPSVVGLGKIDARNPLAVGVSVALQNAGTAPIYAYGVETNDLTGHASAREAMSTRRDLYCFVPLTQDIDVLAAYQDEFDAMANPLTALADGVIQKFRIVVGSVALPLSSTLASGSIAGYAAQAGSGSGLFRTLTLAATGSLGIADVLPGDIVTIGLTPSAADWQNRRGVHAVGHVNDSDGRGASDSILELVPGSSRWNSDAAPSAAGDIEIEIRSPNGTLKLANLAEATFTNAGGNVRYQMRRPTVVGGPYTIQYVAPAGAVLSVAIVGFAITVTLATTLLGVVTSRHVDVAAAVNGHAVLASLLVATARDTTTALCAIAGPTSVVPGVGSCETTITANDALFNVLVDASATFLTAGIQAGDVVEFPLDPQNYGSRAYDTRLISYVVSSVMSENRILIANGLDDSGSVAHELPHFYARDVGNRFLDVTTSATNKLSYRVRRRLTKDKQVLELVSVAQSVRSKRCTITWPDVVQVSDLRDGSLPRVEINGQTPVRAVAGDVPGFYISCQVGGACAGLPSQHGLTNLGLSGVRQLKHSQGYFTERQLSRLSDGGFFVMVQHTPSSLPICIHQLTTDPTALETGELSVVKNVDFISKFFLDLLEPFIGVYNVTPATQTTIQRTIEEGAANLKGRALDRIGPPLLSGTVAGVQVSEYDAARIEIFFRGTVPKPLNTIAFHLVV